MFLGLEHSWGLLTLEVTVHVRMPRLVKLPYPYESDHAVCGETNLLQLDVCAGVLALLAVSHHEVETDVAFVVQNSAQRVRHEQLLGPLCVEGDVDRVVAGLIQCSEPALQIALRRLHGKVVFDCCRFRGLFYR